MAKSEVVINEKFKKEIEIIDVDADDQPTNATSKKHSRVRLHILTK